MHIRGVMTVVFALLFFTLSEREAVPQTSPLEAESADAQHLMLEAGFLSTENHPDEAIARCLLVIAKYPRQEGIVRMARIKIVSVLLNKKQVDIEAVRPYLSALNGPDGRFSKDVWNLACRFLVLQINAAGPERRQAIWAEGVRHLVCDGVSISSETFGELDRMALPASQAGALTSMAVLTDLMLLAPDVPSMRELQSRRVDAFCTAKGWENARAAGRLEVMLSGVTDEGPLQAVKHLGGVLKSAGLTEADVLACESEVCLNGKVDKGNAPDVGSGPAPIADDVLRASAVAALKEVKQASDRRGVFLNLFAGNARDAVCGAYSALARSEVSERCLASATDDLSVVVAAEDGNLWSSCCLVQWLTTDHTGAEAVGGNGGDAKDSAWSLLCAGERGVAVPAGAQDKWTPAWAKMYIQLPEGARRELSKRGLQRCEQRLIRWGADAMQKGEIAWAQSCWAHVLGMEHDRDRVASLVDDGLDRIRQAGVAPAVFQDVVERVLPGVKEAPIRRILLMKEATVLFDGGRFADCLAKLDEADALVREAGPTREMTGGLLRAISLMRVGKLDESGGLLSEMATWEGTDEQHAQALFLLAWVRLQKNAQSEAATSLRALLDKYPQTTYVDKAKEIVRRLEGQ